MSATRNPSRQTGLTLLQTRIVQDIVSLVRRENLKAGDHIAEATLAKKIGTTASAISRYENAEYDRYELRTLKKIANACGGNLRLIIGVVA